VEQQNHKEVELPGREDICIQGGQEGPAEGCRQFGHLVEVPAEPPLPRQQQQTLVLLAFLVHPLGLDLLAVLPPDFLLPMQPSEFLPLVVSVPVRINAQQSEHNHCRGLLTAPVGCIGG